MQLIPRQKKSIENMKVFGIGLNKTGTKTLGVCFNELGYLHKSVDKQAFELYKKGDLNGLFNIIDDYESFEDWPWPLIYKEIDKRFPDSKFILTLRHDAETWYKSLCRHSDKTGPTNYREVIYGYSMPRNFKNEHIDFYNNFNQSVRDFFSGKPGQLLEVCWEKGDGWEKLCNFLEKEIPRKAFPHVNKGMDSGMSKFFRMLNKRLS